MHKLAFHRPIRHDDLLCRARAEWEASEGLDKATTEWEPPLWIAVPVLTVLGYVALVLILSL
jgi:hypothetical protein